MGHGCHVAYGCFQGAKPDPNLRRANARVYRLVVQDRLEESFERMEEIKSKVVPLASDKRPEAQELLRKLQIGCH